VLCVNDMSKSFYSTSALLALQSALIARGIPSIHPSVRLSITFRYSVQTNEDTIVRFSASGRTFPLRTMGGKLVLITNRKSHMGF